MQNTVTGRSFHQYILPIPGNRCTDLKNHGFLAMTAHGLNNNWEMMNYTLTVQHLTERHTGDYFGKVLSDIAADYKICNPICTTDSAANMKCAIQRNNWGHFPCFAHTFNLAVQNGLNVPGVSDIINEAKSVVTYFKHSCVALNKLEDLASRLSESEKSSGHCRSLSQEVPTSGNSCYDMICQLIKLKRPLTLLADKCDTDLPSAAQWKGMEDFCNLLEPMKLITTTMSAEKYPTMSYIYPAVMEIMQTKLNVDEENDSILIQSFKEAMNDNLNKHFMDDTQCDFMEVCTFLDPRFRYLSFLANSEDKVALQQTIKINSHMAACLPNGSFLIMF